MSDRILDEASAALRATRGDTTHADDTLARIQHSLEKRANRGATRRLFRALTSSPGLRVAATFALALAIGTTGYAAFLGSSETLRGLLGLRGSHDEPTPSVRRGRTKTAAGEAHATPPSVTSAEPDVSRDASKLARDEADTKAVPPQSTRPSARARAIAAAPTQASDASESSEAPIAQRDRLYREAHELHFVIRDYAAALSAWDQYLQFASDAPLAVEARYNRALCLVRLGSYREAREALGAIARGEQGAYRQREARALLSRLP